MLIIIEGADGVGKTTLAQRLAAKLDAKIIHKGPPTEHPLVEYEHGVYDYVPYGEHIICDRWHLGEVVYGPILRDKSQLDTPMRMHVDMLLDRLGALIVHVSGDAETAVARATERGDTLVDTEQIPKIMRKYSELMENLLITPMAVSLHNTRSDTTLGVISMYAAKKQQDALHWGVFPTYIGPARPQYLLLGERHGPDFRSAFVPFPSTSGHYLLDAISRTSFNNFGAANACEEDVTALWDKLHRPCVVALGSVAAKAVPGNIPYGIVPHPQYIRRFWPEAREPYVKALEHAALLGVDMRKWRP